MSIDRTIFLIDMNSYFASVEQVSNPALRGKPIVICGEGRSVVTTASYEARAFGVKTGMTFPEARRLCPPVIRVAGNMDKYVDTSLRIHKILLRFTDLVEPFSIDECFMDVTHPVSRGKAPRDIAQDVKRCIREELGLRCSLGIGPTKVVAKLASKLEKPDGLVEIRSEDIPRVFSTLPLEAMQGIGVGRRLLPKLRSLGIETAGDIAIAPRSMLEAHFGILGYYLQNTARGIDPSEVRTYGETETAKSVGHSHTLPRDTRDIRVLRSYLLMLSEKVGVRMRADRLKGRTVCLTVRSGDFDTFSRHGTLKEYVRNGYGIYRAAYGIFRRLLPLAKPVRLVGVSISNLTADDGQQYLLEDMEKKERLTDAVDAINKKFGEFTVKPSSVMIAENFGYSAGCGFTPPSRYRRKREQ